MKRFLSIILTLVMVLGLLPVDSIAADVSLSATCTNYKVSFAVSGATVKSGTATPSGNGGTLDIVLTGVTGNVTITPTFSNATVSIAGTQPPSITLDVSSGSGSTSFLVMAIQGGPRPCGTWYVNATVASGGDSEETALSITTDLDESEVKYTQGKPATVLNVKAEQSKGETVTYQWYSNNEKSTEGATAISGETSTNYTPATKEIGTTYYYAVASSGDLIVTSKIAKVTVEAPVVKFTTNLSESEVKYTLGKPATALTVKAEYTGVTEDAVTYQWYSYTDSVENAVAILGATEANYTPATDALGTTYYYAVATCEDIKATSKVAKITIEAPVVKFTTNLNESEVKYTEGKTATALTVKAEYTGVTEDAVTYQWYSYTDSAENAVAISGATEASYTPSTDVVGTTYYYAVATHGELTLASKIAKITVETLPLLPIDNNVVDITDRAVWSLSSYYAKVTGIRIKGATVEKATEDGTVVNIVLGGDASDDAEIDVEFTTELNKGTMSDHTASVTLENGEAQLAMTLKGQYPNINSWSGSVTYTLNFSLSVPVTDPPTRLVEADSTSAYSGVAVELDLGKYFKNANKYYLVDGEQKTPLESKKYTFMTFDGGEHTLVFAASNDIGECPDYVTVTVNVEEIKSGAWLGIETSNGSVNYVMFTDASGNEIEGLTAHLDGTSIKVSVPRTFAGDGKITAKFDLTQNSDGYPKLSTTNSFNGTNNTKTYTTTLNSGTGKATMYLYNTKPGAVSNNYTTYTIDYQIVNELPVLAEGQVVATTSSMTADKTYTIDLDGIFVDPDEDDTITGWMVSVNGTDPVDTVVDENNAYTYQTKDAGEHTLVFYAKDNYNAVSSEKYTVNLTVYNATTTYDVTVTVPEGTEPVFYYSVNAQTGTELTATAQGSVYTVKVPTNVSVISWRADAVGMNTTVSLENNSITLIKPTFTVKADEAIDEKATVTVAHSTLNVAGSENNYLLLGGEKYTFTATPSADYQENWTEGKLESYTLSSDAVEIDLIYKGTVFTFPYFAELTVSEAATVQGIAPVKLEPVKTTAPDYASATKTATYNLKDGKVYEYRVSVPADNENCDQYVTYAAVFTKNSSKGITITKDQIEAGEKGRTTLDRNVASNRGRNVADLYTNVNSKGYKKLSIGDEFKLIATRNYRGVNADWLLNLPYYYVEPEFHYTVVDENGQANNSVITIDDNGNIKAVGEGTAIVMITYDAMTLNFESKLSEGALGDYGATPNDFYGAIWPENTGVFVVSVGSGDSGITTGMTINEDKATGQKKTGKNIDAELDVIYFIGEKGEYTFTPGTEGVNVFVANPAVSDKMSFTGFTKVSANEDGSVTVPLTTGRNIVKLIKDGKVEYQVITAKGTNVTINGEPLETASVAPGQKVKIEFDNLFAPVNRMAVYNTASAVVYSKVSGWEGKLAGNVRGSYGEYSFASYAPKRVVEHFISAGTDDSGYSNSQVTTTGELTVPEDFEGDYFTLSNGSFNVGGFMPYMLGSHYEKLGITPPVNTTSENVNCYLGRMPDISIHVGAFTKTTVSEDGKTFTVTPVAVENGKIVILALYDGEKFVEMQKAIYDGNEIPFTTTKAYTTAKVMVWNNFSEIEPVCDAEILTLW